jgi:hypothetical protein
MTDTCSTEDPVEDRPPVKAHTCSEDKTVFTEDGNSDGWIATDLTIELTR